MTSAPELPPQLPENWLWPSGAPAETLPLCGSAETTGPPEPQVMFGASGSAASTGPSLVVAGASAMARASGRCGLVPPVPLESPHAANEKTTAAKHGRIHVVMI